MTYNVFGGTLSLTQSINQSCCDLNLWCCDLSRPGFQDGSIVAPISQSLGVTYIKFGEEIEPPSAISMHLLDFSYVALFQNQSTLKSTRVKKVRPNSYFPHRN